jgi:hypothetical protein
VGWTVRLVLQGERRTEQRTLTGQKLARLTAGTPASLAAGSTQP